LTSNDTQIDFNDTQFVYLHAKMTYVIHDLHILPIYQVILIAWAHGISETVILDIQNN